MSINNPDKLGKILKNIERDIKNGKFEKHLKKMIKKEKKNKTYVDNKEYFEWLVDFVYRLDQTKRTYDSESFLYMDKDMFTPTDIKNEKYIGSPIFDLFDEVGAEQGLSVIEDYSWSFPSFEWYFKFNGKLYFLCETIGQGTSFTIREEKSKKKKFLDLDKYFGN